MLAPISGRSLPRSGTRALTAPAIIAAALVMICAEMRLMPAMSTTEYIIATSTAPTYGRVAPEGGGETRRLRPPAGHPPLPLGDVRRVPPPAEPEDAVEPALRVQP